MVLLLQANELVPLVAARCLHQVVTGLAPANFSPEQQDTRARVLSAIEQFVPFACIALHKAAPCQAMEWYIQGIFDMYGPRKPVFSTQKSVGAMPFKRSVQGKVDTNYAKIGRRR